MTGQVVADGEFYIILRVLASVYLSELVSQHPQSSVHFYSSITLSYMHLSSIIILSVVGQAILAIPVSPPKQELYKLPVHKGSYPLLDDHRC